MAANERSGGMYLRTRSGVVRYYLASPDTVWRRRMVGARVGDPTELAMAQLGRSTGTSSLTGGVPGVIGHTWKNSRLGPNSLWCPSPNEVHRNGFASSHTDQEGTPTEVRPNGVTTAVTSKVPMTGTTPLSAIRDERGSTIVMSDSWIWSGWR